MAMNTLPASVRPANPAAAAIATSKTVSTNAGFAAPRVAVVAHAANENGAEWNTDPRAVRLLASCAKNPPKATFHRQQFAQSYDQHYTFIGYRAACLACIRDAYGAHALRIGDATGNYDAAAAWADQPSVQEAIDTAIAARFSNRER